VSRLVRVEPVGEREVGAFVTCRDGCVYKVLRVPEYPAQSVARGHGLRALRVDRGLSLREACALLGLQPIEMSALERGEMTFGSEDEWRAAIAKVGSVQRERSA
jgi:hypothetical protein